MLTDLGCLPQPDEIEITLIGPGFGESIVVHLGGGEWLIVDSCVDTSDPNKSSIPLTYLRRLGVDVHNAVKFIIVSHWDDDHVRGIGDVVAACPNARFVCSKTFPTEKFVQFVEAHALGSAATDGASIRNFQRVLNCLKANRQQIIKAVPGKRLNSAPLIQSWSPSDFDDDKFFFYLAEQHPKAGESLRKAVPASGNLTSVVLTIDWPHSSILLGADMEHSADNRSGWAAVIAEIEHLGDVAKGDLVKIPHHGSHTGHHDDMWSKLLKDAPISLIAPFGSGAYDSRPPKSSDLRRISQRSGTLFVTARHNTPPTRRRDVGVARSLREGNITMTSRVGPIGMVRMRRNAGQSWRHELFGSAFRIK